MDSSLQEQEQRERREKKIVSPLNGGAARGKREFDAFVIDIDAATLTETAYRRSVDVTGDMELVTRSVAPKSEVPQQVFENTSQTVRIVYGTGYALVNGNQYPLKEGYLFMVPAGARHRIVNTSDSDPLQFYTVCTPPIHKAGYVQHDDPVSEAAPLEMYESPI